MVEKAEISLPDLEVLQPFSESANRSQAQVQQVKLILLLEHPIVPGRNLEFFIH